MIIACPKCDTSFSLPDELFRPGRKARCSHCGNVFPMAEPDPEPGLGISAPVSPPSAPAPSRPKGRHTLIVALALLICFAGIGYGGYKIYRSLTAPGAESASSPAPKPVPEIETPGNERIESLLRGIDLGTPQQYVVDNDTLKNIVVVQGTAVNKLEAPVDFITVEARLLDAQNKPLAVQRQVCGVTLTLFQLQLLPEKEMTAALNNKVTVITNNTKVMPGGSVPFMVVFTSLPPGMARYDVRVVDLRETPKQ